MARPVTTLVVFFVCLNLWGNILIASGMDEQMGIDTNVGGDQLVNNISSENIPSTTGIGATLFGLYNMLVNFINGVFGFATAGISMLSAAGVPSMYTNMLKTLFGVLILIDVVSFYRGWGL